MTLYRATTSDTPLEMPAAVGYYDTLHEALRDALGAAVSPVGGNGPMGDRHRQPGNRHGRRQHPRLHPALDRPLLRRHHHGRAHRGSACTTHCVHMV